MNEKLLIRLEGRFFGIFCIIVLNVVRDKCVFINKYVT